jgi:hypothetical protein
MGKIFAQKPEKFQNELPEIVKKMECLGNNKIG